MIPVKDAGSSEEIGEPTSKDCPYSETKYSVKASWPNIVNIITQCVKTPKRCCSDCVQAQYVPAKRGFSDLLLQLLAVFWLDC
jgi:hypothetical protein